MENKVVDSRLTEDLTRTKRRRECLKCERRFVTYETIENVPLLVVKSGGVRQHFDAGKIKNGLIKACEKRPVSVSEIDQMTFEIERAVYSSPDGEITTRRIGDLVMEQLKQKDQVAFIRFASVYLQFADVSTFANFIKEQVGKKK